MPVKPEIKKLWVKALTGGKYKQGFGALQTGRRYCCLGVLCRVVGAKRRGGNFVWGDDHSYSALPESLRAEIGLTAIKMKRLIDLNDGRYPPDTHNHQGMNGKSFDGIARVIAAPSF